MAEQWHVFFRDETAAAEGAQILRDVRSGGESVFEVQRDGMQVFVGCRFFNRRSLDPPLDDLLYWVDAPREGTHHPDGILWIWNGPQVAKDVRVPLTAVAPTLLSVMGIDPPPSMHERPLIEIAMPR